MKNRREFQPIVESVGGDWSAVNDIHLSVAKALSNGTATLWDQAKNQGLAAVPQGAASKSAVELLDLLQKQGVFVVPVGEMEGFDRTITGESSMWVNAMLDKRGHESCVDARALIGALGKGGSAG